MFKTPLIIGAGTGWSATSPLHLTLQCANKCSHTGIIKEDHLLSHVYSPFLHVVCLSCLTDSFYSLKLRYKRETHKKLSR